LQNGASAAEGGGNTGKLNFPLTRSIEFDQMNSYSGPTSSVFSKAGSADFQVCRIAGLQTRVLLFFVRAADLEIGGTAGLETCATQ
jgi:hypothetical protein